MIIAFASLSDRQATSNMQSNGHRVLKALPSDILGRREGKSRAESDPAMTVAVIGAHGRRHVDDDDERMDHYAALRW